MAHEIREGEKEKPRKTDLSPAELKSENEDLRDLIIELTKIVIRQTLAR